MFYYTLLQSPRRSFITHCCSHHEGVLLHTAAVTTKEYLSDLNKKYTEKSPKAKVPQWITNIEGKIIRLRRTIDHLTTIINCKKTRISPNHQNNLKEKYYKKYGNAKL